MTARLHEPVGATREVILRFRKLNPDDQQAVIEFLKQLCDQGKTGLAA
jgi:hypothetical protein